MLKKAAGISRRILSDQGFVRFFSEKRKRNIFQTNPIFPDLSEYPQIFTRQPGKAITNALKHSEKVHRLQKTRFMNLVDKKKRSLRINISEDIEGAVKQRDAILAAVAANIIEDENLGLPYGAGFDQYINKLKADPSYLETDPFIKSLNALFRKLNYASDKELLDMYQEVIADSRKELFKNDAAKKIVLKIFNAYGEKRQELLQAYCKSPVKIDEDKKNTDNKDEVFAQIKEDLKEDVLDKEARELARSDLQLKLEKVENNKKAFSKDEDAEKGKNLIENDPLTNTLGVDDDPERVAITNQILQRYKENKRRYLQDKLMIPENLNPNALAEEDKSDVSEEEVEELKSVKEEEGEESEEELEEKEEWGIGPSRNEQQITILQRRLGLASEKPMTLHEVYDNLESVIDSLPLEFGAQIKNDSINQNDFYRPFLVNQNLSSSELLWAGLTTAIQPTIPTSMEEGLRKLAGEQVERKALDVVEAVQEGQELIDFKEQTDLDLSKDERRELDILRAVRRDPYFTFSLKKEIAIFEDRSNEMIEGAHLGGLYGWVLSLGSSLKKYRTTMISSSMISMTRQSQRLTINSRSRRHCGGAEKDLEAV
eukprot:TRINITY_DN3318_c0_g1_i1.p1 TRINITY_DN3318_c0_g1~~TRINITY_DN3318_c0_g1_i1.p1  ORF type:complete len:598 (+),score=174.18 TRINITY_DN3318_c0_g1_i1:114-1907(+)